MADKERRTRLLALIVDDYVQSAQPVGSKALIERHALDMSAATVRNEMAALEDEGLLTHPHTSAGRIPSDAGYRYYVRTLMPERVMPEREQLTIMHQFHQAASDVEAWLQLATQLLVQRLGNLALATPPRSRVLRLKRLQLIEVSDTHALMVAVTDEANVVQRAVELPESRNQDELTTIAGRLNDAVAGKSVREIDAVAKIEREDPVEQRILDTLLSAVHAEEGAAADPAFLEGLNEMLRQPEFGDTESLLDTLDAVGERRLGEALPSAAVEPGGVAIIIGDENPGEPYSRMSFVITRYGDGAGDGDGPGGTIGILGPTRMDYSDAVSHVRYVSRVLSDLFDAYLGERR